MLREQQGFEQNKVQDVDVSVIKEVSLRSTYRCFRIFQAKDVVFDYPAILHIKLKANKTPREKGNIKLEFRYSSEGPGNQYTTSYGAGPFKGEIEILPLKPHESRQIKIRTDSINHIPRIVNPASLTLTVLDSKDQHKGYKRLYVDLKSVENVKREVRSKVVFRAVILTFLITLVPFSKDYIYPLIQIILNTVSQFLK